MLAKLHWQRQQKKTTGADPSCAGEGGVAGPCHQGLKAHHKNKHVANRIVVESLEENMILSPGGRRSHAQATQDSDQVLLGAM